MINWTLGSCWYYFFIKPMDFSQLRYRTFKILCFFFFLPLKCYITEVHAFLMTLDQNLYLTNRTKTVSPCNALIRLLPSPAPQHQYKSEIKSSHFCREVTKLCIPKIHQSNASVAAVYAGQLTPPRGCYSTERAIKVWDIWTQSLLVAQEGTSLIT